MGKRKPSKSPPIVGYTRVSTEEQAAEGFSLEAQEAQIRAYATMRGLTMLELVADPGVSAGKKLGARPGGTLSIVITKETL